MRYGIKGKFTITQSISILLLLIAVSACSQRTKPAPLVTLNSSVVDPLNTNNTAATNKNTLTSNSYKVKRGETLYSIAWRAGKDVRTIALINNISGPYNIYPGQILSFKAKPNKTKASVVNKGEYNVKNSHSGKQSGYKDVANDKSGEYGGNSGGKFTNVKVPSLTQKVKTWVWPVSGRTISSFSNAAKGNKGVDIAGKLGQPVKAAADGLIVYAGNALRGYGNLIIIKHNDDYLSAYAHNDMLLVKEQQTVKTGQIIAKMGNSGTDKTMLHFEIRFRGKSVDPTRYLPKK